jgi:hypothetical protein
MIFIDTKVVSETLKTSPDRNVLAWLVRIDAELALPTVGSPKSPMALSVFALKSALNDWKPVLPNGADGTSTAFTV